MSSEENDLEVQVGRLETRIEALERTMAQLLHRLDGDGR